MKIILAVVALWLVGGQRLHSATVISAAQRVDEPNETVWLWNADKTGADFLGPIWRNYTFYITERPDYLKGSDRVLLNYEDSADNDYQLRITLAIPATVFIMIDDRVPSVATGMPWVGALGFVDTGDNVIISEGGPLRPMSIYRADLPMGDVTFLQQSNPANLVGIYGIAAQPLVPEPGTAILVAAGALITLARRHGAGSGHR